MTHASTTTLSSSLVPRLPSLGHLAAYARGAAFEASRHGLYQHPRSLCVQKTNAQ